MYNITHPSQGNNSQGGSIGNMPPQIQLSSLLPQKPTTIINPQQSLNTKRPATAQMDASIGEQETVFLNKKKIKPEEENKGEDANQSTAKNNAQPVFTDINSLLSQQLLNQGSAHQNAAIQPQLQFMNGLTTANGQLIYAKQDNNPVGNFSFGNNAIYIPFVQPPQTNLGINNNYTSVVAQNQQNVFTPLNGAQMFPQNMRIKNTPSNNNNLISINSLNMNTIDSENRNNGGSNNNGSSPSSAPTGSNNSNGSTNSATEAFMKEFQSKMSGLLMSQNKMLLELKEKNDIIQDTLACLINEMSALKNTIKQNTNEKPGALSSTNMISHLNMNSNEAATTETLISYLYGQNTDFTHQLVLKTNIPLPLYRERNFKFTLLLTDKNGNLVENANRIPLTIGIYNSENVPKFIDTNTAGNKILKGFIEKDLINGSVTFDKIQIKEVTSHFRNGWIFFAVYPKASSNANNNMLISSKDNMVPSPKIRPFILEKVVVKAKKAKEKDAEDSENVFQDDETDKLETISEVAVQQT